MKLCLLIILATFSVFYTAHSYASELDIIKENQLEVGDVLLISLNCMQCRYIESETGAPFSHSGIVLQVYPTLTIGQALGSVHTTSLFNFLKPITPKSKVVVLRSTEFKSGHKFGELLSIFKKYFFNLPFDNEYRWDNFDQNGQEKIYCSELILKLLNYVLEKKLSAEILSYNKHYEYWFKVFKGNVPMNEWGNSPASLYRDSNHFEIVGHLE